MADLISFNPPPPLRFKDKLVQSSLQTLVTYFNNQFQQISRVVNSQMTLSGLATALPAKGTYIGQHYFETDTLVEKTWNGTAWQ